MHTRFSKSVLGLAAASLLFAGSTMAGNGYGGGNSDNAGQGNGNFNSDTDQRGGPANRMARISAALGLSEQQEMDLLELFHEQDQERARIHADVMEAFGDSICAQRRDHQEALIDILTPEQYALHQELMEQRAANRGNRRGGRGMGNVDCPADG